jgi:hypothetical protein
VVATADGLFTVIVFGGVGIEVYFAEESRECQWGRVRVEEFLTFAHGA